MSEIRRRKQKGKPEVTKLKTNDTTVNGVRLQNDNSEKSTCVWFYFNIFFGTCFALYIGYRYAGYMKQLHENDMWFSNIQASICMLIVLDTSIFNFVVDLISCLSRHKQVFFLNTNNERKEKVAEGRNF